MSWPTARVVIVTLALLGLAAVIGGENARAQDVDEDMAEEAEALSADELHAAVMTGDRFPSANVCGQCHPKQYREWSVSPHAYGQLSPVILAFQNATTKKVTSTVGDFCQRCHAPISAALGQRPEISALDRPLWRGEHHLYCLPSSTQNLVALRAYRSGGRHPRAVYSTSFGEGLAAVLDQPSATRFSPSAASKDAPSTRRSSPSSSCARRTSAAASVMR